jgi:hypothetical protein
VLGLSPEPSSRSRPLLVSCGGAGNHRSGAEMKKIFGAKKDKGPPPSIQDATERVSR